MSGVDESPNSSKKRINGVELAADIRGGMDESHLLEKYGLSHDQLQRGIGKLVSAGLLTEAEVQGAINGEPDLHMTIPMRTCPLCNHVQSDALAECSKCGLVFSKLSAGVLPSERLQAESSSVGLGYGLIAAICCFMVLLAAALGWAAYTARKEARVAYERAMQQEESRKAAELKAEELKDRELALVDREYDIKQAEYKDRVNGAVSALSMAGQRWTEVFDRKMAAYERITRQDNVRHQQRELREQRAQKARATAHFRLYGSIVKDFQHLGVDYRTHGLSRTRLRQVTKAFQSKLFALKTYPAASPTVIRRLESASQNLMTACRCARFSDARGYLEDFWSEANAAMELMSREISDARS